MSNKLFAKRAKFLLNQGFICDTHDATAPSWELIEWI